MEDAMEMAEELGNRMFVLALGMNRDEELKIFYEACFGHGTEIGEKEDSKRKWSISYFAPMAICKAGLLAMKYLSKE